MAKRFNLAELMGAPDVSKLDTPELEVMQIPLTSISANKANFYDVENVDDLKESIEMVGLQQPLVVLSAGDGYRLIAGHRRYKALTELGRESAPCVIQRGLNDTQEQLALILTNSTARELSPYDKMQQAKKLKELYVKRREEGAELPGRIRDMVAEAMQESASNIARLEAINNNLQPSFKRDFKSGKMNQSTAYEISKLSSHAQSELFRACKEKHIMLSSKLIKAAGEIVEAYPFAPISCPKSYGSPCTRYKDRAKLVNAGTCPGCCADCDHTDGCQVCCGHVKKEVERSKAAEERRDLDKQLDAEYMKSDYRRMQMHLHEALKNANDLDLSTMPYVANVYSKSEPVRNTWSPSLKDLCDVADALHTSVACLLGLESAGAGWKRYPEDIPPEDKPIICIYRIHGGRILCGKFHFRAGNFGDLLSNEFVELSDIAECNPFWIELPEV